MTHKKSTTRVAAITSVALLLSLGISGVAMGVDAPNAGLHLNTTWQPGQMMPQDSLFIGDGYTQNGDIPKFANNPNAVTDASSTLGAVKVTAVVEQAPNRYPGTFYAISDGAVENPDPKWSVASRHGDYKATENMYFEGAEVINGPALDLRILADPTCAPAGASPSEILNYSGECDYGTLTFKFDRPVSDPILDVSGLGGLSAIFGFSNTKAPASLEQGYAQATPRGTNIAQKFVLETPGVQLEGFQNTQPTNLQISAGTIQVANFPVEFTCNPEPRVLGTSARFTVGNLELPQFSPAGCGSIKLKGTGITEVKFRVINDVRPISTFKNAEWGVPGKPGASWGLPSVEPLRDDNGQPVAPGRTPPDGLNGQFYHPSVGTVQPFNTIAKMGSGNPLADITRVSLRLPTYSVGDFIWEDTNQDGLQTPGEPGVPGVTVELLNEDGTPVTNPNTGAPITTTTDQDGKYIFNGLAHGVNYRVRVVPPAGKSLTTPNAGNDDTKNSKMDQFTRTSGVFSFDRDAYWNDPSGVNKINLNLDGGLITPNPHIEVVKKINGYDANDAANAVVVNSGEDLKVSFQVKNTGNVPLRDVTLSDSVIAAGSVTAPAGKYNKDGQASGNWDSILAPGEYAFFTATIPALAAGAEHTNTATVEGTPPPAGDQPPTPVRDTDDAKAKTAKLVLKKYINSDDAQNAPGVVIPDADGNMTIKYTVTNPSAVEIRDIRITDTVVQTTNAALQADITAKLAAVPAFNLAAGASKDIEITVAAPVRGEANNHKNEASATGTPVQSAPNPPADKPNGEPNQPNPPLDEVTSEIDPAHATKPAVSLGDRVWDDTNKDGLQTDGEKGVPGVTVELLDETGAPVLGDNNQPLKQVTGPNGEYLFDNLKPGSYKVKFTAPEGYAFSPKQAGNDVTKDSNADPATGITDTDEVLSGSNLNFDAGLYRLPSEIEVLKTVNNRVAKPGDNVMVGAESTMFFTYKVTNTGQTTLKNVTLRDNQIQQVTAPEGVYDVNGNRADDWAGTLKPGQYAFFTATKTAPVAGEVHENIATVEGTPPPVPGSQTPPPPVTDDDDAKVYVPKLTLKKYINGQDSQTAADSVLVTGKTMTIKYVVRNEGQVAVNGITLADTVNTPANSPLQAEITAAIDPAKVAPFSLQPGAEKEIEIVVSAPTMGEENDHKNTAVAHGTAPEVPDNGVPPTGTPVHKVPEVTISSNEDPAHAHKRPVTLGDFVWEDTDRNGVQNDGEKGLSGVTVTLLDGTGNPVKKDGQPVTTVTGEDGSYKFENLEPGTYSVKFTPPFGYAFSPKKAGGDETKDSNADPETGVSEPEEILTGSNLNFDAGLYKLIPGITVIKKINGFDANTPEAAAVVETGGDMTVTFFVKNTGDTVLTDVKLTDSTIDAASITPAANKQTADGNDAGAFDGSLNPGESVVYTATAPAPVVAAGTHQNTATVTGVPPIDPKNPPADPNNPPTVTDTDDANAVTPKLTLKKYIDNQDAQDEANSVAVIGDTMVIKYVVNNAGTTTVTGIKIADRVTVPAEDGEIAQAIASELAKVEAFDLPALGEKTIEITVPAPAPGEKHADFAKASGIPQQPIDPNTNNPREPEPGNPGEPNADPNVPPVTSDEDPAHAHKPLATLGDKVWKDNNKDGIQDDEEPGVPGVKVHLLKEDGSPVLDKDGNPIVQTTGPNGEYLFEQLYPGKYKVRFERPAGWDRSPVGNGDNPEADSDADITTGESPVVTLGPGDRRLDIDSGLIQRDPAIDIVKKLNGFDANTVEEAVLVPVGSDMVLAYVVTNTGGTVLNNVTVSDKDIPADALQTPAKRYALDGAEVGDFDGTLNPEEYVVFTATVKAPEVAGAKHKNTGVVTGVPPIDPKNPPVDPENPPTVTDSDDANAITPKLTLKKYINEAIESRDAQTPKSSIAVVTPKMKLVYVVTNESPVELRNVRLTDRVTIPTENNQQAVIDEQLAAVEPFTLAAGESRTIEVEIDAPAAGEKHQDYAQATGEVPPPPQPEPGKPGEPVPPVPGTPDQPGFPPVTSNEDPANAHTPKPAIDVEKFINTSDADTADQAVAVDQGSTMKVSFRVENTGDTKLTHVTLRDDMIDADKITARDGFDGTLEPGQIAWFDATYPAPAANALHKNTATVEGTPVDQDGNPLPDPKDPTGNTPWKVTDEDPAHAKSRPTPPAPPSKGSKIVLAVTGANGTALGAGAALLLAAGAGLVMARRRKNG